MNNEEMVDLDPEIVKLVDEHFWELFDEGDEE